MKMFSLVKKIRKVFGRDKFVNVYNLPTYVAPTIYPFTDYYEINERAFGCEVLIDRNGDVYVPLKKLSHIISYGDLHILSDGVGRNRNNNLYYGLCDDRFIHERLVPLFKKDRDRNIIKSTSYNARNGDLYYIKCSFISTLEQETGHRIALMLNNHESYSLLRWNKLYSNQNKTDPIKFQNYIDEARTLTGVEDGSLHNKRFGTDLVYYGIVQNYSILGEISWGIKWQLSGQVLQDIIKKYSFKSINDHADWDRSELLFTSIDIDEAVLIENLKQQARKIKL